MSLKPIIHCLKLDAFWTALAERSSDIALTSHEKQRRASLAAAVQSMCDVCPHPCPFPRERENHSFSVKHSRGRICWTAFRESGNAQLLFPLPGGEGQGEDERKRNH